jgi:nicotinamidase/pyrazinamidase
MDLKKTVFWCVDAQVDFIDEGGKLPVPDAETIKPNLKILTDFARKNNIKVVNTMDWHFSNSKELSDNPDFINTFPPHCMANTEGVRFIPETSPDQGTAMVIDWSDQKGMNFHDIHKFRNLIIRKDAFDVFAGNNLTEAIVNNLGIPFLDRPTFVVYGVSGDVCVSLAVDGLMKRGYEVILVSDAVKSLNQESFNKKLDEWKKSQTFRYLSVNNITQTLVV